MGKPVYIACMGVIGSDGIKTLPAMAIVLGFLMVGVGVLAESRSF
jgi:hypothetical protein